ncbi:hypothetical protein NDU88_004158 [Pleurodeles waltl]|uniref:Uncharacterized protein n=1 Tax=Pleurodeles waltl TaxID=8319 RepID=A0AAV7L3V6_PLEWA|nr:hypothetical protein NDU88_004158 [Pleurodeles waltl]
MLGVSCRLRLLIRTRHLLFDGRLRYRARLFAVFDKSGQLHSVAHGYAHIPVEMERLRLGTKLNRRDTRLEGAGNNGEKSVEKQGVRTRSKKD